MIGGYGNKRKYNNSLDITRCSPRLFSIKNADSQLFLPSARSGQEVSENQGHGFAQALRYARIFAIYFRHFLPVAIINRSKAMAAGRNGCLGLDSSMTVIS